MDRESRPRVELLVADVTLEVLRLLVLDEDLFVVKLPVAVPAENWLILPRDGHRPRKSNTSSALHLQIPVI